MLLKATQLITRASGFWRGNLSLGKRPLAYVGGWVGQMNLGDEALLAAAEHLFNEFGVWRYDGSRTHNSLLNLFPITKNGIFAGGTLINRCIEYLQTAERFLDDSRQLHVFGTGVAHSDFWRRFDDFHDMLPAWKQLLNRCGFVGVRGPVSAEILKNVGVEKVEIVGDPVITFAEEQRCVEVIPNSVGLNIGHDHGHQWGDESRLASEVLNLAKTAKRHGWGVKWFVVFPRDLEITKRLADESGTSESIFCVFKSPQSFVKQVRRMSTFVGMKLHATMLATCAHVPALMLEYDPKCMDYMASIGQEDSVVRTDHFKSEPAWELLKFWNQNREPASLRIYNAIHALRSHQLKTAADLTKRMLAQ